MRSSVDFGFGKKKEKNLTNGFGKCFLESFPQFLGCSLKVILCDLFWWVTGHIFLNYTSSRLTRACAFIRTTLFWRVWSWLRVNAGGMVKTCKSNEKHNFGYVESGERVRNTWATCPWVWNSPTKVGLMPYVAFHRMVKWLKLVMALKDGLAAYQLVGEVKAHQG